jgi:DNA repair photolyase
MVDLRSSAARERRHVDAVVQDLLRPLFQARPEAQGYRLAGWDAEQGISLTLERGDEVLLVELERRDDARDCSARTGRFNLCARRPFDGRALSALDRRAVEQLASLVRAREGSLPAFDRPATSRASVARAIEVERVLIGEGRGHYYVNPYVGCTIGCEFCYVARRADLSRELEGLPQLDWGRWVDVKANAAEVLRREAASAPPGIVRFSPIVTDPYQPIERRFQITRQCLEVLADHAFIPCILTRAALVARDLDVLARFPVAAVGLSIPTDDDRVRAQFEPGADPIDERIEALQACHRAGLRTFAVVQPMLPMDPDRLVERLAPFVRAVRVDRMYEVEQVRHQYRSAGREDAATDAFFAATGARLLERFRARGVPVNELDDLSQLVAR